MFSILHEGGGVIFSKFSRGGHVLQTLFPKLSVGEGDVVPTASLHCFLLPFAVAVHLMEMSLLWFQVWPNHLKCCHCRIHFWRYKFQRCRFQVRIPVAGEPGVRQVSRERAVRRGEQDGARGGRGARPGVPPRPGPRPRPPPPRRPGNRHRHGRQGQQQHTPVPEQHRLQQAAQVWQSLRPVRESRFSG